ncbi:MAG TPA: hypothetical protein VEU33_31430 [Archangium sp.]|nr:hypothetical protein [Archangium sp.]
MGIGDLADRSVPLAQCVATLHRAMEVRASGQGALPGHLCTHVALMGMRFPNEQDAALHAAAAFQPLTAEQLVDVRRRAVEAIEGKGAVWWNPGA